MQLDEYRESRDIDFLCAGRKGFCMIRGTVDQNSLGKILRRRQPFAREVRANQYGVRTFVATVSGPVKLEVLFEARIV